MIRLLLLALLVAGPAGAAERAKAGIDCRPAGERLVYDCAIRLFGAKSRTPIEGVEITLGAEMPSMPMAHSVPPVEAEPTGEPGLYRARLRLEMAGDWALKLRLSGPVRDQLVEILRFE
jgi:hypothetical protein